MYKIKYKINIRFIQMIFILFSVFLLFFYFKINVYALGNDEKNESDNSITYGKNHIQYTLAEVKCAINNEYTGCTKDNDNDNNYVGIKNEDYMVSDKNIRYYPLVISNKVPAFTENNDFTNGEPKYVTEGASVKERYINTNNQKKENSEKNRQYNSVILYLHRVTPNIKTYENNRKNHYYMDNTDFLKFEKNDNSTSAKRKKSIVDNIGDYEAPSQEFIYNTVPFVLGYEGSAAYSNGKSMVTVMDEINGYPVPVTLDNQNTGLFSLNGPILDGNTPQKSEELFPKYQGAKTTSTLKKDKNYGYNSFYITAPNKHQINLDLRGSATIDTVNIATEDGLLAAIYEMGGPQYIASIDMAKSEALTQRNSVYNFMASLYANGNYVNTTLGGNKGQKSFWNRGTYGILDKTINDALKRSFTFWGAPKMDGKEQNSDNFNIKQVVAPNLKSTCSYNTAIKDYCNGKYGRFQGNNQNFKGSSVSLIRTTTIDGLEAWTADDSNEPVKSGIGKIYNYNNEVYPTTYSLNVKTSNGIKQQLYNGYRYLPNGKEINNNTGMNSSFYYGYYGSDYGVWRQDGFSPLFSGTSAYFPNDTTEFPQNVNDKTTNWAGVDGNDYSQSDYKSKIMRYPWSGKYKYTADGTNSKRFLNSYISKIKFGQVPSSLIQEYALTKLDFENILQTYPDMLYRIMYFNDEMENSSMNDCKGNQQKGNINNSDDLKGTNACFTYPSIDKISNTSMSKILSALSLALTDGTINATNTKDFVDKVEYHKSNTKYSNTWDAISDVLKQSGNGGKTTYLEDLEYIYLNYFALKQHADEFTVGQAFSVRNGGNYYNDMQFLDTTVANSDEFLLNEETRLGHDIVGETNDENNPIGTYTENIIGDSYGIKYGTEIYNIDPSTGEVLSSDDTKENNCPEGYKENGSSCQRILYENLQRSCPTGYAFDEKILKCVKDNSLSAECDDGFQLEDGKCVSENGVSEKCDTNNGYEWNNIVHKCVKQEIPKCSSGIITDINAENNLIPFATWDSSIDINNNWLISNAQNIINKDETNVSFSINDNSPSIETQYLNVKSDNFDYLQFKMNNETPMKSGKLYFKTTKSNVYDDNKVLDFDIVPNQKDEMMNVYTIKLKGKNTFQDTITGIKIVLNKNNTTSGQITIDWIKIGSYKDNSKIDMKCINNIVPICPTGAIYKNGQCVSFTPIDNGKEINPNSCDYIHISPDESYKTTNYQVGDVINYQYTNNVQKFVAPIDGDYYLETWGASGKGKGGYTAGIKNLKKGQTLYIYVGGMATNQYSGYNGKSGGYGGNTDMRLDSQDDNSKIIIAGGGASSNYTKGLLNTFSASSIQKFKSPTKEIEIGHSGNGYAKITLYSANNISAKLISMNIYDYTGKDQTFTVPNSGKMQIEAYGAQGNGELGGKGGYVTGELNVNAGDTVKIIVGQQGQYNHSAYGGGGYGKNGGGGASYIYVNNTLKLVAGGGGGQGGRSRAGGAGGGLIGGTGYSGFGNPGSGGTQNSGGEPIRKESGHNVNGSNGMYLMGGKGAKDYKNLNGSAGGGGGYYGGAGGGNDSLTYNDYDDSGAGGGSSYYGNLSNSDTKSGINTENGKIIIGINNNRTQKTIGYNVVKPTINPQINRCVVDKTSNLISIGNNDGMVNKTTQQLCGNNRIINSGLCADDAKHAWIINPKCPANSYFNESSKSCYSKSDIICPNGFKWDNDFQSCIKSEKPMCTSVGYDSEAIQIDKGDSSYGWKCERVDKPYCPDHYKFNSDTGTCQQGNRKTLDTQLCPDGYTLSENKNVCKKTISVPKSEVNDTLSLTGDNLNVIVGKTYLIKDYAAFKPAKMSSYLIKIRDTNGSTLYHTSKFPSIGLTFELNSEQIDSTGKCRNSKDVNCNKQNFTSNNKSYIVNSTPIIAGNGNIGDKKNASSPIGMMETNQGSLSSSQFLWSGELEDGSITYDKYKYSTVDLMVRFDKDQFCYANKTGAGTYDIQNGQLKMTCTPYTADPNNYFTKTDNGKTVLNFDTDNIKEKNAKIPTLTIKSVLSPNADFNKKDISKSSKNNENSNLSNDFSDIITGFKKSADGDLYIDKFEVWDTTDMMAPKYSFQAMSKENCSNGYNVDAGAGTPFTKDGNSANPGYCEPIDPLKTTFKLDKTKNYFVKIYTKYVKVKDDKGNINLSEPASTKYVSLDVKHSGSRGAVALFPITTNNITSKNPDYPVIIRSANVKFKDTSTGTMQTIYDKYSVPFDIVNDGIIWDKSITNENNSEATMQYPVAGLGRNHTNNYVNAILNEFTNGNNKILDTSSVLTIPATKLDQESILNGKISTNINSEMIGDNKYETWDAFPFKYEIGNPIDNKITVELRCNRGSQKEVYKAKDKTCWQIYYNTTGGTLSDTCDVYAIDTRVEGSGDTSTSAYYQTTFDKNTKIDASKKENGKYIDSQLTINQNTREKEVKLGTVNNKTNKMIKASAYYDPSYNKYIDSYLPNNLDTGCWLFEPVDYAVSNLTVKPAQIEMYPNDNNKNIQLTGTYKITKNSDNISNRNVGITYWLKTNGNEHQCSPATPINDIASMSVGNNHQLNYTVTCPFIKNEILQANSTVNPVLEVRINGGLNGTHAFSETDYTNNVTATEIFVQAPGCIGDKCYTCDATCSNRNDWTVNYNMVYKYNRGIKNYQTNTYANLQWSDHSLGSSPNDNWTKFSYPTSSNTTNRSPKDYLAYQSGSDRITKTNLCTDYRSGNTACWRYENNVSHNINYYKKSTAQTKYFATTEILGNQSGYNCATKSQSGWGTSNGGSGNDKYVWGNSTTNGNDKKDSGCHGYTKSTGSHHCETIKDWWGNTICKTSNNISKNDIADYIPNENFNKTLQDGYGRSETTNNNQLHFNEVDKQGSEHSGWTTETKTIDVCTNPEVYFDVKYRCPNGYRYKRGNRNVSNENKTNSVCSLTGNIRACKWTTNSTTPKSNDWWSTNGQLYESTGSTNTGNANITDTSNGYACYSNQPIYNYICPKTYTKGSKTQEVECSDKEYIGNDQVVCKNVPKNFKCSYTATSYYTKKETIEKTCSEYYCERNDKGEKKCKKTGKTTRTAICYSGSDNKWVNDVKNGNNKCSKGKCDSKNHGGGFDETPEGNDRYFEATYTFNNKGLWCEPEHKTSGQYRYRNACYDKSSEIKDLNDKRCVSWKPKEYKEIKYYDTNSPKVNWTSRTYNNPVKIWQYTCNTSNPSVAYPGQIIPMNYYEELNANAEIRTERSKANSKNNSTNGWITLQNGSNSKEANPRGGEWFEVRFTVKYNSNRGTRPSNMGYLNGYYNNYHNITSGSKNDAISPSYNHNGITDGSDGKIGTKWTQDVINDADWGYCNAAPNEPYGCSQTESSELNNLHFNRPGGEQNSHSEVQANPPSWKSHTGGSGVCYYGPDNKKAWKQFGFYDSFGARVDLCKGNTTGTCSKQNRLASRQLETTASQCTSFVDGLCVSYTKVFEPQKSNNNGTWRRGFYVPVGFDVQTATIQIATERFNAIGAYEQKLLSNAGTEKSGYSSSYFSSTKGILPLCTCKNWPITLKDGEVSWASTEVEVE